MKLIATEIVDGKPVDREVKLPPNTPADGLQALADTFNRFAKRAADATYRVTHG